jgi:Transcriptional regulatory protein, C terminal
MRIRSALSATLRFNLHRYWLQRSDCWPIELAAWRLNLLWRANFILHFAKKFQHSPAMLKFFDSFRIKFPTASLNHPHSANSNDPSAGDYVVNVLNCTDSSVAYGFAISSHQKNDIIACIGREQPVGCYLIDIRFQPEADSTAKYGYLLVSVCLFGLLGLVLLRPIKTRKAQFQSHKTEPHQPMHRQTELFTLGSIVFDVEARKLISNGVQTDLTKTETRVLRIFAQSPNETIERSQIQKEIWENDGVMVGRSLDMFISKLRKKLEPDPCIKIAVVRGKGYRFEVD